MSTGIAVAMSEMPVAFVEAHGLNGRHHDRGGEPELRFLFRDVPRVLPVLHEGQFRLVRWGTRRGESKALPPTGWTWLASVESGGWGAAELTPIVIPATMAVENGIWFRVQQGIRGVLVSDDHQLEAVYMLCEPSSHYFRMMTRSDRMPVLIGQRY